MAPIIETSYDILRYLKKSGKPFNPPPPPGFKKGFIYVPSIKLYIEEESHLEENWDRAHEALFKKKLRMLKIPEYITFLNHVKKFNERIYKNITQVGKKYPWRIEGLDAYFIQQKGNLNVSTESRRNTKKLKPALMEDREISFDSWLEDPNSQGLPKPDIEKPNTNKDKIDYIHPENNKVAGLEIRSNGVIILACDLNPSTTGTGPPVFVVRGCFSLKPEKNLERFV